MSLRRRERVFLCRLGFVLFGLLPTVVVIGWIVRHAHPRFVTADRQEWQRELSQRTGLTVAIGGLQYPNHYTARLTDVRLSDPEAAAVVVRMRSLDIVRSRDGWSIDAAQPVVDMSALASLAGLLHDRLVRGAGGEQSPCDFSARELTLQCGSRGLTLAHVSARRATSEQGMQLAAEFQLPEQSGANGRSRVSLARNAQQRPAVTRWELHAASPLPCGLLADLLPAIENLGDDASFQGMAWCAGAGSGMYGEIAGTLTNVDLDRLVTEKFPHQLSGLATLQFSPARIEAGRLVDLRGTLRASDGRIGASLLAACGQHLGLRTAPEVAGLPAAAVVPYRQLSLGFQMNADGLSLAGSGDATRDGVLLASAAGILLEAPPQHRAPAIALISALVPVNQVQVPATAQTKLLVQTLPIPTLELPQTAARQRGHTPTRLDRSYDPARAVREGDRR